MEVNPDEELEYQIPIALLIAMKIKQTEELYA